MYLIQHKSGMIKAGIRMSDNQWYKEMAVYQIWTRSFCDGNGDGIGDLWGVLNKLDYIKSLGVNAIWFSPIYPSPNADYGYDISDYRNIHPDFGNLEVFKQVLDGAHSRGMRVFMDLVVNHSSDEHRWFKESKSSADNPYHDYYIWRKGKTVNGKHMPPNNWTSNFDGSAWEYVPEIDEYYLHLFAKKQPDLNMANPKVREEVKGIMRFWLDMGVDGFREDVINYIGKDPSMPNSYPKLPMCNGMQYYTNMPQTFEYLKEFKRDVLDHYDCFTVGEGPLTDADTALKYISEGPNKVLDEMISFSHMGADCFLTDVLHRKFSLRRLKRAVTEWQIKLEGVAWNCLYLENHDHPRIISRYGSEKYRTESGKMLAAMYMLLQGTPFIYQGQEIGMLNIKLPTLSMYRDVQTYNNAAILSKLMPKKKMLELLQLSSRDNARTPMQWSDERYAGFSESVPWFFVNDNYKEINVKSQENDDNSLLNYYRRLVKFRSRHTVAIYGSYRELCQNDENFFVYERELDGQKLLVICCFTDKPVRFEAPRGYYLDNGELVLSNYEPALNIYNGFTSRPYECRVYLFE